MWKFKENTKYKKTNFYRNRYVSILWTLGPNKDDHLNYRPRRSLIIGLKDPVKIVENYLLKKKILSHSQLNLIKKKILKYLAHLNLQKKLRPLRSKNMKDWSITKWKKIWFLLR